MSLDMQQEILFLIIGIAIPLIIQYFIFPFLPKSIQSSATYNKKLFMKIIKQSEITPKLIVKSENAESDKPIDEVIKLLKESLGKHFVVKSENRNLNVSIPIGSNTVELTIIPMHYIDDDVMKFDSLECRFTAKCRFSKFNACVRDFREAQRKIEGILHDISMPRFKNSLSLVCKLKSLHEITDILQNTSFELISAELDNGKQFELNKNEIIIYDQDINDDVIALAEKMIIMYD